MKKIAFLSFVLMCLYGSYCFSFSQAETLFIDGVAYIPMTTENQNTLGIAIIPSKVEPRLTIKVSHGIETPSNRTVLSGDLRLPFLMPIDIEGEETFLEKPLYYQSGILYIPYTAEFRTLLNKNQNAFNPYTPLHSNLSLRPFETRYNTFDTLPINDFIRDQGAANTCWAYAANTAFEIALFKQTGKSPLFSVTHMIENAPIPSTVYTGGNFNNASTYYLNQSGPVTESAQAKPYQLTGYHTLNGISAIKEHVKTYGSVITSIYFDPSTQAYYNAENNAYYNPSLNNPITHDLLIVGWDDHFPKSAFANKPSRNGAYIALNSFGANWGENGVFYISYEDVHASSLAYALTEIQPTIANEKVQFYNDKGLTHFESYQSQSSVFGSVKYTNPQTVTQWVTEVGVYVGVPNTHVSLFASYTPASADSFESNNALIERTFDSPGYYKVPLRTPLKLEGSQPYYLHAIYSSNDPYQLPIQATYPGIYYELSAQKGQSFIGSLAPEFSIVDLSLYRENGTLALRAYLNTTP